MEIDMRMQGAVCASIMVVMMLRMMRIGAEPLRVHCNLMFRASAFGAHLFHLQFSDSDLVPIGHRKSPNPTVRTRVGSECNVNTFLAFLAPCLPGNHLNAEPRIVSNRPSFRYPKTKDQRFNLHIRQFSYSQTHADHALKILSNRLLFHDSQHRSNEAQLMHSSITRSTVSLRLAA